MTLSSNAKGGIAVVSVISIIALAYILYSKYKKGDLILEVGKVNKNFTDLQSNSGLKPNKDDIVIAKFNSDKNKVQFYTNNRFFIFDDKNVILIKGTYSDGGKTLIADNGKRVDSGSIWANISDILI
jgi:hypothetical protein